MEFTTAPAKAIPNALEHAGMTLKDVQYQTGSHKPYFFNNKLLENMGFDTSELFYDEDFLENFDDRSDDRLFREKLHNVKNTIYSNIYNNTIFR